MSNKISDGPAAGSPRLLDRVRERIRLKHYSILTEQAYVHRVKRYILFHDKRHLAHMGKADVEAFLTSLAVERDASAATQSQTLSAPVLVPGCGCWSACGCGWRTWSSRREIGVREGKGMALG